MRWSLLVVGALVVAAQPSAVSASAVSPPAPAQGRSQPDLGILSERRSMLRTRHAGAAPVRAQQPLIACSAAWRVVDNPNGAWNNFLGGVAAISPTDMWAVGASQAAIKPAAGDGDVNLAEHWDGSAWALAATPDPGADDNYLNDVAAIATNDVWAVGASNTGGSFSGATYHWNGSAWSFVSPAPGGSLNDVAAFASNDVWAVGQTLSFGVRVTQIQHWTGSGWSLVPSPNVGTGDNVLYGVGGSAANDVWAVGYFQLTASAARQSLIEHWNGSTWSVPPYSSFYGDTLLAVAATSTSDVWAVGYETGSNGGPVGAVLHWNGSNWANVGFSEPSVVNEVVAGIAALSSTEVWAIGFDDNNGLGPFTPFALHYNGSTWETSGQNGVPAVAANGAGDNLLFNLAVPSSGDVWAAGTYANPQGLGRNLMENYSGLAAPTAVTATPGDQTASVSWSAPCGDGGSAITAYVVTAYDGCTIQDSKTVTGAPPATTLTFTGLSNGTAFTFRVAAVNGFGLGPRSGASSAVKPVGATPAWVTACSPLQYLLGGSDGVAWQNLDFTNLNLSFTPAVDSYAVLSGNADLWTANAGFNQDLGVAVSGGIYPTASGQPEAWKESGGFAGTFSPNAAYVQAVIPVVAGTAYTARLQWKTNKPGASTIFAGAGPIGAAYSPTRLTVQLIPTSSAVVFKRSSSLQYKLTGSNGSTWVDMDTANLNLSFTPPAGNWLALMSGSADLWTSKAGYNQDIGISVTGAPYPLTPGQPEGWKESGGFAGTFSPNAAFVQVPLLENVFAGGSPYTTRLVWKANKPDPGTIFAGAGPINGHFSPTSLSVILLPVSPPGAQAAINTKQFSQVNSDGITWQALDLNLSKLPLAPSVSGTYAISINADLWTSVAGYNQDIGIMVSGGAYGPGDPGVPNGTLVAWKESGGFAGTFSPNAAFVTTNLHLEGGVVYTVWAVWKANRLATVSNAIWAGAGPINAKFSGTWLTAVQLA